MLVMMAVTSGVGSSVGAGVTGGVRIFWMDVHPVKTEQSIRIANNDATDNDRFHDLILKKGQGKPYRLLKNSDSKSISEKYFTVNQSRTSLCFFPGDQIIPTAQRIFS